MSELSHIDINNIIYNIKDEESRNSIINLLANSVVSGSYNSTNRTIELKNASNAVVSTIQADPFIKDGMVSSVTIVNGNLVISFNTDAGKAPISIPLADIFDPSDYYDKNVIDSSLNNINAKIDALSAGAKVTLSISPSTIYRNEAQTLTLTGTMSNGTPTSMKIMDGSTELATTGTNPVTASPTVTVTGTSKTYTLQGVTLGMTLNGSAAVNARYPIFYGFAANAAAVVADADTQSPVNAIRYTATTSAAHTYERTLVGSTDLRFYILVPSDITAPPTDKFTMGGAPFVIIKTTQNLTVKGNSVSYSVYASGYEYSSGTKIKVEVKS